MSTHTATQPQPHRTGPGLGRSRPLRALGLIVLGATTGILAALIVGAVHTSSTPTTTVVETAPTLTGTSAGASAGWAAVYAAAAPGTVDITVQTSNQVQTPFGTEQQQETALGSGFVVDGNGEIVTAAHVVDRATSISAAFADGHTRTATLSGKDDAADVAVVHVDPAGLSLHPLTLGSSRAVAIGQPLAIIGDPLGFERSLSTGVVSGLDRTIQAPNGFQIAHSIQTDAAMNPGNSGGPLLNERAQVIGIADQIATGTNQFGRSTTETSTGVGFAVPVDLIKGEIPALAQGRTVTHAYLGVATSLATGTSSGAVVASVTSGTPASRAGLRAGDVIVSFGGRPIASNGDLIDAVAAAAPGTRVPITVRRGGERQDLTVTLASQPAQAPSS